MRCVSYTRTLPWRPEEELVEIQKQNTAISDFISQKKGWSLIKKYSDRKKDVHADAGFEQMIRDGMERKFDCIIIFSLYYCGTGFPIVKQMILDTLMEAGIHLVVVQENFDSSEKNLLEVKEFFETKRREMHADIFRRWKDSRGKRFVLTNSVPFGYVRPNGSDHLIKDDSVKMALEEIFRRKIAGESNGQIARWLNDHNIETPYVHRFRLQGKEVEGDKKWSQDHVRRLIRGRVYTGMLVKKDGQTIMKDSHEPYLTEEEFFSFPENQDKPKANNRVNYRKPNPLSAILICGNCGSRMQRKSNFETGESWIKCNRSCKHDPTGKQLLISEKEVSDRVIQWLHKEQALAKKADSYFRIRDFREKRLERREQLSWKMKSILAEMELEQFRRVPLYEKYSSGLLSEEEYEKQCEAFRFACEELDRKLSQVMEDAHNLEVAFSIKNPWIMLFTQANIPDTLDKYTVHKLIEQVTVKLSPDADGSQIVITPKLEGWKSIILDTVTKEG